MKIIEKRIFKQKKRSIILASVLVLILILLTIREVKTRSFSKKSSESLTENANIIPAIEDSPKPFVTEFGGFSYTFKPGAFGDFKDTITVSAFARHGYDFDKKYRLLKDSMILVGSMQNPKKVDLKGTFEVKTTYDPKYSIHVDKSKLVFLYTPDSPGYERYPWTELPTLTDDLSHTVTGIGSKLGNFVLVGPLICPQDKVEPDDNYDGSNKISKDMYGQNVKMIFDVPKDENWIRFSAIKDKKYRFESKNAAQGVRPIIMIFDPGGVEKIAEGEGMIEWTPPQELFKQSPEVNYFVSINAAQNSKVGCDATFDLVLTEFEK